MSGAVGTAILSAAAAAAVGAGVTALATPKPKTPKVQAPEAPPAPQAARLPDQLAMRTSAAPMLAGTPAGTMLTGAQGVTGGLNLGKNQLLGL